MASKDSPRKTHRLQAKGQAICSSVPATPRRSSRLTASAEDSMVDEVQNINRHLLAQIDTLKLKIDVDKRQHDKAMTNLISSSDRKLKTRELEIENLRSDIGNKDRKIKNYAEANKEKQGQVFDLERYINELREDVDLSKVHAEEIQMNLNCLRMEKAKLESGDAYSEKDMEIQHLQKEMDTLKKNLEVLERELAKAKKTIIHQDKQLRDADQTVSRTQMRLKDELANVSLKMRHEVEKVREVMKMQWNEMKQLREQNEDMRCDLREIKELLVSESKADQRRSQSSPVFLRPLPVSLPGLSVDNSRRKKK